MKIKTQEAQMATKKRKKMGSGWVKINTPQDLQAAIQRMINKILMSRSPWSMWALSPSYRTLGRIAFG